MEESTTASMGIAARSGSIFGRVEERRRRRRRREEKVGGGVIGTRGAQPLLNIRRGRKDGFIDALGSPGDRRHGSDCTTIGAIAVCRIISLDVAYRSL